MLSVSLVQSEAVEVIVRFPILWPALFPLIQILDQLYPSAWQWLVCGSFKQPSQHVADRLQHRANSLTGNTHWRLSRLPVAPT